MAIDPNIPTTTEDVLKELGPDPKPETKSEEAAPEEPAEDDGDGDAEDEQTDVALQYMCELVEEQGGLGEADPKREENAAEIRSLEVEHPGTLKKAIAQQVVACQLEGVLHEFVAEAVLALRLGGKGHKLLREMATEMATEKVKTHLGL